MSTKKTFFTTGEFASLCKVTKDTLFHYEQIGLLYPEKVERNGYRYYSFEQYFIMDMIGVLKEAKTSLYEIKEYMNQRTPERYLTLLEEKKKEIEEEKRKLERIEHSIIQTMNTTKKAIKAICGQPRIEHCTEEWYIVTPVRETNWEEKSYLQKIKEHLEYCKERQIGIDFFIGSMIEKESIVQNDFNITYISSRIFEKIEGERFYKGPDGMYAMIEHHGFYDSLEHSYYTLIEYIKEQQYKICGMAYENDLLDYLMVEEEKDYMVQIAIQVEKEIENSIQT